MDDIRIEWMRDVVYKFLRIDDNEIFHEFIERDDNENERDVAKFLNETSSEVIDGLFFFTENREEEIEEEVECEPSIPDIDESNENPEGEGENGVQQNGEVKPATDAAPPAAASAQPPPATPAVNGTTENGEPPVEGEDQEQKPKKTKIIIKKITKRYLYHSRSPLPSEKVNHPSCYFIRTTNGVVPPQNNIQEAHLQLPIYFEIGYMYGDPLVLLQDLMRSIYDHMLSYHQQRATTLTTTMGGGSISNMRETTQMSTSTGSLGGQKRSKKQEEMDAESEMLESRAQSLMRDEFLMNMKKFESTLTQTIQQIEGEVKLEIPDLVLSDNDAENLANRELMSQIENTMLKWDRTVSETIESLLRKTPLGNGPLAEIDYWRDRNTHLSALVEQYKLAKVQRILHLHSLAEGNAFDVLRNDLNKYYVEAKDNVK